MTATVWLILKAVAVILPILIEAIQTGRIKTANEQEILDAFTAANNYRVKRAVDARDGPDNGLPDGNDRDEP
jgi:hypothetical protein